LGSGRNGDVKSKRGVPLCELSAGSYKLLTHELLDRDPLTFNPRGQLFGYPPSTILRRRTLQRPPSFSYRPAKPSMQMFRLQSENIIQ